MAKSIPELVKDFLGSFLPKPFAPPLNANPTPLPAGASPIIPSGLIVKANAALAQMTAGVDKATAAFLSNSLANAEQKQILAGQSPAVVIQRTIAALDLLDSHIGAATKGMGPAAANVIRADFASRFNQEVYATGDVGTALRTVTGGKADIDKPDFRKTKQGGAGDESFAGVLQKTAAASTAAFATLSVGLGGLTRAASPALFNTLTQSLQLLAATVGQSLVGPVLDLSFKLQDAAHWVQTLDPAIKANVASWLAWGAGIFGATFVLSKLTGIVTGLLPLLGAMKAATVFTFTSPGFLLLAAGATAAAGAMGAFGQFGYKAQIALGAVAGAALATATAFKLMGVAFLTTPLGLAVTGLAAVAGGLLAVKLATNQAQAAQQAYNATVNAFAAIKAKAQGGGPVTHDDLLKLMSPEEQAQYGKLDDAGKRKFLQEKGKESGEALEAARAAGYTPEEIERRKERTRKALGSTRDQSAAKEASDQERGLNGHMPTRLFPWSPFAHKTPAQNREEALVKGYVEEGMNPDLAKALAKSIIQALGAKAGAANLSPEDIEAAAKSHDSKFLEQNSAREAAFKEAAERASLPQESPRLRELKKLQTRYGLAFQHEMSAQSMDVGSVRGTIQNLGLNQNPIEAEILAEQREANRLMREHAIKALEDMNKKL